MTISVTWQLIVTLDSSICNSCDVLFTPGPMWSIMRTMGDRHCSLKRMARIGAMPCPTLSWHGCAVFRIVGRHYKITAESELALRSVECETLKIAACRPIVVHHCIKSWRNKQTIRAWLPYQLIEVSHEWPRFTGIVLVCHWNKGVWGRELKVNHVKMAELCMCSTSTRYLGKDLSWFTFSFFNLYL